MAGPRRSNLLGGAAAKGGFPPPKAPRRCLPLLGLFPPQTLGAWALGGLAPSPLRAGSLPPIAHKALRGRWTLPVDPQNPSGGPGTILVYPRIFSVTV